MSASEKLKALERYGRSMGTMPRYAIGQGPNDSLPPDNMAAWERYRDALPQIVALTEAAEETGDQFFNTPERYVGTQMSDLRAALTALDEALP